MITIPHSDSLEDFEFCNLENFMDCNSVQTEEDLEELTPKSSPTVSLSSPSSAVNLAKSNTDTGLPKDIIEQYILKLEEYNNSLSSLDGSLDRQMKEIRDRQDKLKQKISDLDLDFNKQLNQKINEIISQKRQEKLRVFDKQIQDVKNNINQAEQDKEKALTDLNKGEIREELISKNTTMRNFLLDIEDMKKEYGDLVPQVVKNRVELDFDLNDVQITEFDLSLADGILDRISVDLELCKERLNADKIHNLINMIFVLNVDYLQGFPAYMVSVWYIFILCAFAVFSIVTVPLYLFFVCFICFISFSYERTLIEAYTALLSLSKVANKYNEDLDGQVAVIYDNNMKDILDNFQSKKDLLTDQITRLESNRSKVSLEKITINKSNIEESFKRDLSIQKDNLQVQINSLREREESLMKQKEEDALSVKRRKLELDEYKERLSVFFDPQPEKRMNELIYMNGLLMGFKEDNYTPYYIHHNKRATLIFYDKDTQLDDIRSFVYGVYINSTAYMKDGHCSIDLIDIVNKGLDFTSILPNDDVFDNDAEKIKKYPVKLHSDLDKYFKELNDDINTRVELMPRSGSNNIDLFNQDRIEKKSKPLAYRIPLFFSFNEGTLADKNLQFLLKTTGATAVTDTSTNLGIIPFICIPYQYFFKDTIETILKCIDMVGYDNILGLEDDLVKLNEKQLSDKINFYKKKYENIAKSIEIK